MTFEFQKQFIDVVVHGEEHDGLEFIQPGGKISTAGEAVDVYRMGYLGSLINVMTNGFSKLKSLLGESAFDDLVTDYIAETPSTHWDINNYGRTFPVFLKNSNLSVAADFARLELLYNDVASLKRHSIVDRSEFQRLEHPNARIRLASTLSFFQSQYLLSDLWFKKASLADVKNGSENFVLYRKGRSVGVQIFDAPSFQLLRRLQRRSLEEALTETEPETIQSLFLLLGNEGLIEKIY